MHSNRIITIQRRAKRRLLVLTIAATAFVGYSALSLFAEDRRPIQPPIEKMNHVPGVKAVGIRMISPSGKLPAARIDIAPTTANTGSSLILPPSQTIPLETSMPSTSEEVTPQPPFLSLPTPSLPTEGKDNLSDQNTPDGSSPESNQSVAGTDLVDIRVVQPCSMGQPAKMPPFVFEKSSKKPDVSSAQSSLTPAQPKVRIAITDNGVYKEIAPPISISPNVTQSKNRFPQLVKSKPTQIAHTVVLAQSTNLELQSTMDQPDGSAPPVQIDSPLVPHSIFSGLVSPNSETVKKPESTLTHAVADTFASHSIGARNEPQLLSKRSNTSSKIDSIDSMRRSFDSSLPNQSPIATVELECLTATSMNLVANLVAIAVQDENVCKAFHNERTISLVGNQSGTTLVQFWTTEPGSLPQVVRVNVSQPWGRAQSRRSDANDIKQVIAQGFPRSDVKILSKDDGTFEVQGTTDSEESARRILELVRKLYLVPVKDRLTVSN